MVFVRRGSVCQHCRLCTPAGPGRGFQCTFCLEFYSGISGRDIVQHAICIGWIINWAILFWMEQAVCSPRIILQMPWDPGGGKLFIASGCRLGDKPDSKDGVLLGIGPAAL